MKKLNIAGLSGFILCFAAIIYGIGSNGGLHTIINFLHFPSFLVTFGGAIFAVLTTSDSFQDFLYGLKGFIDAFTLKVQDTDEISSQILGLSDVARKEGLLALEEKASTLDNPFLSKSISLIVDGTDPELVKDLLESELNHKYDNERKRVRFWETLGSYAPAWGMVGTLLGLINMMKTMGSDPGAVGDGMSLALITTLYGSLIANWICIPLARKLDKNCEAQYLEMELIIEGTLSIQAGENPRIIKEKIKAILEKEELEEETAA